MGTYGIEIRIKLKNIDITILCVGTFDAIGETSISCNFQEVKRLATKYNTCSFKGIYYHQRKIGKLD